MTQESSRKSRKHDALDIYRDCWICIYGQSEVGVLDRRKVGSRVSLQSLVFANIHCAAINELRSLKMKQSEGCRNASFQELPGAVQVCESEGMPE